MERNTPFFKPGGTMDPSAPSYIERAADEKLLSDLLAGEYVSLLDSRQKGKSSLIARTIVKLHTHGVQTVKLDLQRIGANVTAEQWYAGLLASIGTELNLTTELFAFWESHQAVGPLARWISAISEVVLKQKSGPVVIFVDEVDFVRALSFPTDEFFAGIRDCYNRRSEGTGFERLTFCLVGVATPGQLIRNPEITPFNIGSKIELSDFTLSETAPYAAALSNWSRNGELLNQRIHYWVNGHPYLTQLLCSHVFSKPEIKATNEVDKLVKELFFTPESRHREPNFADVERRILDPDVPGMTPEERKTQVLDLYGRLLRGKGVEASEENPVVVSLRLAGVGNEDHGSLRVRNRVYKTVFDEGWRRQSLPNAELRRQRGAARLAILRTAAVAGVVVLAISSAAVGILRISKEREKALIALGLKTRDLTKVSSDRKVALTDLEKRNLELKRISKEREDALTSLGKSNEDLKVISSKRQEAVEALEHQAIDLRNISVQSQTTLTKLRATKDDLEAQNYVGLLSSMQLAISQERWAQASDLIEQSKNDPNRNWEWGHLALPFRDGLAAEAILPTGGVLERQPDGRLCAITEDAVYDVSPTGVRIRRKFASGPFWPGYRRGNIRLGQDTKSRNEVFRDANSDAVIAELSALHGKVLDFDPISKCSLIDPSQSFYGEELPSKSGIAFELRTLDSKRVVLAFKGDAVLSARFLPDGTILTSTRTGEVIRYDQEGKVIASVTLPWPGKLSVSPDGTVFTCTDDRFRLLEIRRCSDLGITSVLNDPPLKARMVSFWPEKNRLIVATGQASLNVFDLNTGNLLRSIKGHSVAISSFTYVGDRVVSADMFGHMKFWNIGSLQAVQTYVNKGDPYQYAWFESDPNVIVLVTESGTWSNLDIKSGKRTICEDPDARLPSTNSWGSHLYIGRQNGRLDQLSLNTFKLEKSTQIFKSAPSRIFCSANGKRLVVEHNPLPHGNKTEYSVVDTDSMKEVSRFKYHWPSKDRSRPDVTISADGSLLAVSSNEYATSDRMGQKNGVVHLFSTTTGRVAGTIHRKDSIWDIELLPDGKSLLMTHAVLEFNSKLTIYSVKSLKEIAKLPEPAVGSLFTDLWIDPRGEHVFATGNASGGFLWDLRTRRLVSIQGLLVRGVTFSPDGNRLIPRIVGEPASLWDCKTGKELIRLDHIAAAESKRKRTGTSDEVSFSPDGRKIVAVSSFDGVVRLYHSVSWKDQPKTASK